MLEDDALDRLYRRLETALFQIAIDDPDIEWRNSDSRRA